MRVAAVQLAQLAGEDKAARVERVVALVGSIGRDADLVVLPELWDVGYFGFDRYEADAAPLADGPVAALAPVARSLGIVVAGSVLERDGDRLHNTTAVIGPSGQVLGAYRKHHLFGHQSREVELLTPGPGPVVVDTPVGRLGLSTCFDLRFPAQFAALRADGADALVVPAAWPAARREHWRVLVQARAIETQTPIVAVNGAGPWDGVALAGHSMVVDGRGTVLAEAGDAPGCFAAVVDHADTAAWRAEWASWSGPSTGDAPATPPVATAGT